MTQPPQPPPRIPDRIARWGFFVVALILGTALLVSSITSYVAARRLVRTVIRGQVQALERTLAEQARQRRRGPPTQAELQAFVDAHTPEGLRYLGWMGPNESIALAAGTSDNPQRLRPGEMVVVDNRVRAAFLLDLGPPGKLPFGPRGGLPPDGKRSDHPPGAPPHERDGLGPPPHERDRLGPPPHERDRLGPPPHGRGRLGPGRPGLDGRPPLLRPPPRAFVLELVPEAAVALQARARRDLGVGVTVAVALMLAAAVFWRLSRRAQAVEADLHTQKHLAALGEMSAVLAHELRNPLASLKGHAQLLAERVAGEPGLERKTARIVDEAQRLEALTNGLLEFARTGKIDPQSVDPAALLQRCARACEGVVEIDDDGAPTTWTLDGPKLERVLDNLLNNARQAAPDAPILARVYRHGAALRFEVHDQGPGVPASERARIFEPFHTTRTRGTGLGLPVSRRIVEQHGGTLDVRDADGGGACLVVTLPSEPFRPPHADA